MTLTAISPMHTYTRACCSIAAVLAPYFSEDDIGSRGAGMLAHLHLCGNPCAHDTCQNQQVPAVNLACHSMHV